MLYLAILTLALTALEFVSAVTYASRPAFSTIEPSLASIVAAEATVVPLSPTSNVGGKAFDRIVQIWLENTVCAPTYKRNMTNMLKMLDIGL
jgi:acid phosphatase